MSRIDNFVLFAPGAGEPPAVPWAAQLHCEALDDIARARHVPRWVELGGEVYGDEQVMAIGVWGMVTNHRDAGAVIDAFMNHDFGAASRDAWLLVYRDGAERSEVYYRRDGAALAQLAGDEDLCGSDVEGKD